MRRAKRIAAAESRLHADCGCSCQEAKPVTETPGLRTFEVAEFPPGHKPAEYINYDPFRSVGYTVSRDNGEYQFYPTIKKLTAQEMVDAGRGNWNPDLNGYFDQQWKNALNAMQQNAITRVMGKPWVDSQKDPHELQLQQLKELAV